MMGAHLAPGETVDGRYRLIVEIGAGAHGVVYRARDLETQNDVALKFLSAAVALDPEYNERLGREATAMARLRGTSAVYVHGFRQRDDGALYVVMEMLHGRNLENFLREAEQRGGRLKRARMLEMLRPIADTLEAAHAQGIVHRDLKPSNIFVIDRERGGGVRLLDFGLVKLADLEGMTIAGMVMGTPSYIAPETWRGDPRALDHRIDVYALGVIVFRCLGGRVPFKTREIAKLIRWTAQGERPSLRALRPKLPPSIDAWVQKALAARPEDRFQDVRTLWNQLERCLATAPGAPF